MTKVEPIEQVVPETRIDLLDRQSFVDRLLEIAELLSKNKKNACYAVDGDWGTGKTFVLDLFEEQAAQIGIEGDVLSRFVILRYNCWEYDFYEEPLIAIVSSLLDQIDLALHIMPQDKRAKIKATLRRIGSAILWGMIDKVKKKTGIPIREIAETVQDGIADGAEEQIASKSFDHYFDFKKNLEELRTQIAELSKEQTVLFIVDELDRCLPEYTIKVLERLHHLFFGLDNVQVILATDIGQLSHTVETIYGVNTNVKKYLHKIIQFSVRLDIGTIKNNRFEERFAGFVDKYSGADLPQDINKTEIDKFIVTVFEGIDTRKRISIIDKCELIHELCNEKKKYDYRYLCLELFLAILHDTQLVKDVNPHNFRIDRVFDPRNNHSEEFRKTIPTGVHLISELFKENRSEDGLYSLFLNKNGGQYLFTASLLGQLLYSYRRIIGCAEDVLEYDKDNSKELGDFAVQFWKLLQVFE